MQNSDPQFSHGEGNMHVTIMVVVTKIKVMDVFQKIGTPVQLASLTFTSQTMIANR